MTSGYAGSPAAIAAASCGRRRARSVPFSTIARPPFFSFTLAPVRRGDLVGEVRLVADQEDGAAPGRQARSVEWAAAQLLAGLGHDPERLAGEAGKSAPPAPWCSPGRRRARRRVRPAPFPQREPALRPWRSAAARRRPRRRPRRPRVGGGRAWAPGYFSFGGEALRVGQRRVVAQDLLQDAE